MFDTKVIDAIRDKMIEKHLTVSVAESVTAGYIQAAISAATQASLFFQGGITVYNLGQKCRHLQVEPIHAMDTDCVSERVAIQMAIGVNKLFTSDYGIAVTGYATTVPEKDINELSAYFAIAVGAEIKVCKKITLEPKETMEAQLEYTRRILEELNALIDGAKI